MQVTIHTKEGSYTGVDKTITETEADAVLAMLKKAAAGDYDYFTMETANGHVIIGKEPLVSSVIVVRN